MRASCMRASRAVEAAVTASGTGISSALVAMEIWRMGAVTDSTAEGAGLLLADALALASARGSVGGHGEEKKLALQGLGVDRELDGLGGRSRTEIVASSLQAPFPTVEVHRGELGERRVGKVDVERLT